MHWEIHWQMFLLYPLKVHMYLCTFWHPHFRFRNVPKSTSLKHCTREILVLVSHMREEGLELCKFKLSTMKAFFGWRDSPVKMSHTSFPPLTNNLAIFLLAQFDEDFFLDFWGEGKNSTVPLIHLVLPYYHCYKFVFLLRIDGFHKFHHYHVHDDDDDDDDEYYNNHNFDYYYYYIVSYITK